MKCRLIDGLVSRIGQVLAALGPVVVLASKLALPPSFARWFGISFVRRLLRCCGICCLDGVSTVWADDDALDDRLAGNGL